MIPSPSVPRSSRFWWWFLRPGHLIFGPWVVSSLNSVPWRWGFWGATPSYAFLSHQNHRAPKKGTVYFLVVSFLFLGKPLEKMSFWFLFLFKWTFGEEPEAYLPAVEWWSLTGGGSKLLGLKAADVEYEHAEWSSVANQQRETVWDGL